MNDPNRWHVIEVDNIQAGQPTGDGPELDFAPCQGDAGGRWVDGPVPAGGGCDRSIAVNTGSLTAVNLDMSCLRSINWRPGATIWLLHGYA